MNSPEIKIIAISNVFIRIMIFKSGDIEKGHCHNFDHATLVSTGSILYEVLDSFDGNTVTSKEFKAPNAVFVDKDKFHRITALENDTVCACIHALRTIDEDIIDPDFLIEPIINDFTGILQNKIKQKTGKTILFPVKK